MKIHPLILLTHRFREVRPSTLELLACYIPQRAGESIDAETLLGHLCAMGQDIDMERLERLLAYLLHHEQIVEVAGGYRQARWVKWGKPRLIIHRLNDKETTP